MYFSIRGTLPHYWNFAIPVGVGSVVGSAIAVFVPGAILKVLFGALCLIGAWRFMTAKPLVVVNEEAKEKPRSLYV